MKDLTTVTYLEQQVRRLKDEVARLNREGDTDARIGRFWVGAALGGWFSAIMLAAMLWGAC